MKAFLTEWSQGQTWPHKSESEKREISALDFDITRQRITQMSMQEFARAGLAVTVNSAALGEYVIFVSDNTPVIEQMDGLIEYRAAELNQLAGVTTQQLREIHALKKNFGVSIEFIKPAV